MKKALKHFGLHIITDYCMGLHCFELVILNTQKRRAPRLVYQNRNVGLIQQMQEDAANEEIYREKEYSDVMGGFDE